MLRAIQKIKLNNFKRFTEFEAEFDDSLNLLVGDNECGKSTILMALDLVLGGSRNKIEAIGLENLFNIDVVNQFLHSSKKAEELPILFVEIYLNEQNDSDLNGKNNSEYRICDGLRLVCEPNDSLSAEIKYILKQEDSNFPFEFYDIKYFTFSGKPYTGYNRPIRHLLIDSAQINNEYATRAYVKDLYNCNVVGSEKYQHQNEYRKYRENFKNNVLIDLNARIEKYSFTIRSSGRFNLESDLTIAENGITIESKGKGQQCFIKTEFALKKPQNKSGIDILLLEEPENHLSHINMKKLILRIKASVDKQLFIATHNSLVSSRLDLRRCILLNINSTKPALMKNLPNQTANFFMKAPDNSALQFILSKKVVLVEGDSEYILFEAFYKNTYNEAPETCDIHVISVDGTSFKRYLDLAKLLKIKTAVLRDNDRDFQHNCIEMFAEYSCDHIKVFSDGNNSRYTFEVCIYEDNETICEELFCKSRRTLTVQEFMIKNKAEAAFMLLQNKGDNLKAPQYILDAMEWIRW